MCSFGVYRTLLGLSGRCDGEFLFAVSGGLSRSAPSGLGLVVPGPRLVVLRCRPERCKPRSPVMSSWCSLSTSGLQDLGAVILESGGGGGFVFAACRKSPRSRRGERGGGERGGPSAAGREAMVGSRSLRTASHQDRGGRRVERGGVRGGGGFVFAACRKSSRSRRRRVERGGVRGGGGFVFAACRKLPRSRRTDGGGQGGCGAERRWWARVRCVRNRSLGNSVLIFGGRRCGPSSKTLRLLVKAVPVRDVDRGVDLNLG